MRLIDADKINFNETFIGASDFAQDTRKAAQTLIDSQPTVETGSWQEIASDNTDYVLENNNGIYSVYDNNRRCICEFIRVIRDN